MKYIIILCMLYSINSAAVEPYFGTTGYASSNLDSLVSFDLHIPYGDKDNLKITGVTPEIGVQIGTGSTADDLYFLVMQK